MFKEAIKVYPCTIFDKKISQLTTAAKLDIYISVYTAIKFGLHRSHAYKMIQLQKVKNKNSIHGHSDRLAVTTIEHASSSSQMCLKNQSYPLIQSKTISSSLLFTRKITHQLYIYQKLIVIDSERLPRMQNILSSSLLIEAVPSHPKLTWHRNVTLDLTKSHSWFSGTTMFVVQLL